jgi:hypothetical protein
MYDVFGVTAIVYAQKIRKNSGADGPAWPTVGVQRGFTIAESTAFFYGSVRPKGLTKKSGSLSHTNCSSKYFHNKEINKLC